MDWGRGPCRRYPPSGVRRLLAGVGLHIEAAGGLFHSLLLPRALAAAVDRLRGVRPEPAAEGFGRMEEGGGLGAWSGGKMVTAAVGAALAVDNALSALLARGRLAL